MNVAWPDTPLTDTQGVCGCIDMKTYGTFCPINVLSSYWDQFSTMKNPEILTRQILKPPSSSLRLNTVDILDDIFQAMMVLEISNTSSNCNYYSLFPPSTLIYGPLGSI